MNPRRNTLTMIQGSFAGRKDLVERAFHDNEAFRELCEHYLQCLASRRYWERQDAPEALRRCQEYTELLDDLGREIRGWLDAIDAAHPRSSTRST